MALPKTIPFSDNDIRMANSGDPNRILNNSTGLNIQTNRPKIIPFDNKDIDVYTQQTQPKPYTGPIESGASPVTAGQRAAISFGNDEGTKNYLNQLGFETLQDAQGNLLVKKGDRVYRLDEAGWTIKDFADMLGKAIPTITSIGGTIAGGIGGSLVPGVGTVLGGGTGGTLGAAAGESIRQGIGNILGTQQGIDPGQLARESAFGAVGGLTAGTGRVLSTAAAKAIPALGIRAGESVAPRIATKVAGEFIEGALQGGVQSGGETLVRTGDFGEALKSAAEGAAVGGPAGVAGYGVLGNKYVAPYIEKGFMKLAGGVGGATTKATNMLGYGALEEGLSSESRLGRPVAHFLQPLKNVLKGSVVGDEITKDMDTIAYRMAQLDNQAKSALKNSIDYISTNNVTKQELDNAIGILQSNTTKNPQIKSRNGKLFTVDELIAQTTSPHEQNIIKQAFEISKSISEAMRLRGYKTDTGEIFATKGGPAAFFPIIFKNRREMNLDNMINKLLSTPKYQKMRPDLAERFARETAMKQMKALSKRIAGPGSARRKLYSGVSEMDASGVITDWADAWQRWIEKSSRSAAVLDTWGKNLVESAPGGKKIQMGALGKLIGSKSVSLAEAMDVLYSLGWDAKTVPILIKRILKDIKPIQGKGKTAIYNSVQVLNKIKEVTGQDVIQLAGLSPTAADVKAARVMPPDITDKEIKIKGALTKEELTGDVGATSDDVINKIWDDKLGRLRTELEAKFDADEVNTYMKYADTLRKVYTGADPINEWVSLIKQFQTTRLSTSFMKNVFQPLNIILESDFPSLAKGGWALAKYFTGGKIKIGGKDILPEEFSKLTGSQNIPVFETEMTGRFNKFVNKVLWPLTKTEKFNRIWSSVAGAKYAESLEKIVNAGGPAAQDALTRLNSLVSKEIAPVNGKIELSMEDLSRAAYNMTKKTQFGFDLAEMPWWVGTNVGSLAFQFKSFAYNQTRLLANSTIGELRSGNPGRAFSNMIAIGTLFGMSGEVINAFENFMYGKETKGDALTLERWIDDVSSSGAMGMTIDMMQQRTGEGFVANLLGPTAGTVGTAYEVAKGATPVTDVIKRQLGGVGRIGENLLNQ